MAFVAGPKRSFLFWFVFLQLNVVLVRSNVPGSGLCNILTFIPFTYRGQELPYTGKRRNNLGFSHMAAALLAAQHFNERDASVIKELANPEFQSCNVQFDMNSTIVLDTEIRSQAAARQLQQYVLGGTNNSIPCALVGAYFDQPARELSVMASTLQIPLVAYRIFDPENSIDFLHPYTIQTNGVSSSFALPLIEYLQVRKRTNHIAFLVQGTSVHQTLVEAFQRNMQLRGLQTYSVIYLAGSLTTESNEVILKVEQAATQANLLQETIDDVKKFFSLKEAMEKLKQIGFRTIVVLSNPVDIVSDIPLMANLSGRLEMNNGDYFWMWLSGLPAGMPSASQVLANPAIQQFFRGSALMDYADKFRIDGQEDAFLKSWRSQDETFLELLKDKNPIPKGMTGHYDPDDDYFQTVDPEEGAGFLYDSVISVGMGACLQQRQHGSIIDGESHLKGIKATNFTGASGRVLFGDGPVTGSTGVRKFSSGLYVAYNLGPPGVEENVVITDVLDAYQTTVTVPHDNDDNDNLRWPEWIPIQEHVFASGKTTGPPLRNTPEQNFLSKSVRAVGFTLLAIVTASALGSVLWLFLHSKHQAVRASQPGMIFILLFGVLCEGMTILTLSFDESHGLSVKQLSRFCVAGPWLFVIGHGFIYTAIFAKLWRVHKVLQFSRVKITFEQAIWPVRIFLIASIANMTAWTIWGNYVWDRVEVNEITGESFGRCEATTQYSRLFIILEILFLGVPVIMSLVWSWKTKDVDESFSESSWIFVLIMVQVQTAIVGVPLFIILRDLSTDGRYMGQVLVIWMHSMSAVVLIMLPKILSRYGIRSSSTTSGGLARGTRAGTRITGLELEKPPPSAFAATATAVDDSQYISGNIPGSGEAVGNNNTN